MKQGPKKYCFPILLSATLMMACAGTEVSERASTEVSESTEAQSRQCGSPELSQATQGRENVQLMEPPFMEPTAQVVLPQRLLKEYISEPYVLRYQVVKVDALLFRNFLQRESEIADQDCWSTVLLKLFDEGPVEFFRDTLPISNQGAASGYGAWVGRSEGDVKYSFQIVVDPNDAVTMQIQSKARVFQVNATKSLPYHVLWEWDTEFFGPSADTVQDRH